MSLLMILLIPLMLIGSLFTGSGETFACEDFHRIDDLVQANVFKWLSEGDSFLGVFLDEVDSDLVEELGLEEEYGAHVRKVIQDSPADEAGLKKDDVIIRWNETRIESAAQIKRMVRETPVGRKVHLGVIRKGREKTIDVTLEERSGHFYGFGCFGPFKHDRDSWRSCRKFLPESWENYFGKDEEGHIIIGGLKLDDIGKWLKEEVFIFKGRGRMGVRLQSLTPQLADYFGLKDGKGVLISSVREGSPADRAGLKAGDVIMSIDGEEIEDPYDVVTIVEEKEEGTLSIVIMRDKQEQTLDVHLEEKDHWDDVHLRSQKADRLPIHI